MKTLFRMFLLISILTLPLQSSAQSQKQWTFLIFLNGNNNLDAYGTDDINEMEQVGSTDEINVVVQWGSLKRGTTQRLLVQKDNNPSQVTSPVEQDLGATDMGDWRSLQDFIRWGIERYPAKHYFINVWDHGSGWHARTKKLMPLDISWDERTGHFIKTEELGQVMRDTANWLGRPIDIYGSDACLMGMAEVAAEMTSAVKVFIGDEEVEPVAGWPYDTFLRKWNKRPQMDASSVSKILVEEFIRSYQDGSQGSREVTLSALDLQKMPAFSQAVRNLSQNIRSLNSNSLSKLLELAANTQKFSGSDYRDALDFLSLIKTASIPDVNNDILQKTISSAQDLVISNGTTPKYDKAHGIAIWLPISPRTYEEYIRRYEGLQFDKDTSWSDALICIMGECSTVRP